MPVHTFHPIWLAIQKKPLIRIYAVKAQTERLLNGIANHAIRRLQFGDCAIKIRVSATVPEMRILQFDSQRNRRRDATGNFNGA